MKPPLLFEDLTFNQLHQLRLIISRCCYHVLRSNYFTIISVKTTGQLEFGLRVTKLSLEGDASPYNARHPPQTRLFFPCSQTDFHCTFHQPKLLRKLYIFFCFFKKHTSKGDRNYVTDDLQSFSEFLKVLSEATQAIHIYSLKVFRTTWI